MGPFRKAIEALYRAADSPDGTGKMTQNLAEMVVEAATGVDVEDYDEGLQRLAEVLGETDRARATAVAFACGILVEAGGKPALASKPLIALLPDVLTDALTYVEGCVAAAEEIGADVSAKDEKYWIDKHGIRVARKLRKEALAWEGLDTMTRASLAMLTRSRKARRQARAEETLLTHALNLAGLSEPVKHLTILLQVLDDEDLIVLHPEQKRGYRVTMSGISDNMQLHTLLADALIGPPARGLLAGKRPDPRTIAAARDKPATEYTPAAEEKFTLWTWRGLRKNATLPDPSTGAEFWVWKEGTPADIPEFEGQRVVLLGPPPPFERRWSPGRRFPAMHAELAVQETLTPVAVRDWLDRIGQETA